jgi:hypothetical protein
MLVVNGCSAQMRTATLSNKNKGTYLVNPVGRFVVDSNLCTISIKVYELDVPNCKRVFGKVSINGVKYKMEEYDNPAYSFILDSLPKGLYRIKVDINNYYTVTTDELDLKGNGEYDFSFYVVRKKLRLR